MYKLFVLAALVAVAAARPGYLPSSPLVYSAPATTIIQEPSYAHVGSVVKSIPTSVSHQSHSIVHSSAHVVQDVVAPVVKTTYSAAPLVHQAYASPLVHSAYTHSAPVYKSYASPLTYAAADPWSYGATYGATYAAPAHYSAW